MWSLEGLKHLRLHQPGTLTSRYSDALNVPHSSSINLHQGRIMLTSGNKRLMLTNYAKNGLRSEQQHGGSLSQKGTPVMLVTLRVTKVMSSLISIPD